MTTLGHLSSKEKMIIMLAVMSGLFMVALDQTIVATALGAIVKDFQNYTSLGLVVTAYLLFLTITVPIAGKLSDLFGRRPLLLIGVGVFTFGSLFSALAPSIEILIAARALQGIGGGIVMANAFTIIGDLFSPRERGKWQGIIGGVFGMSSVVGPLLGGFLTDAHTFLGVTTDWRWNFYINIPIGIFAAYVIARHCPKLEKSSADHTIDYAGAILLTLTLAALIAAVDNTELLFGFLINNGVSLAVVRGSLFIISALSLLGFIAAEHRSQHPILPLSFFKNRTFTSAMISLVFFGVAFLSIILYMTQFNQQVYAASATKSGLMLLPLILGMSLMSGVIGQIVTKTGVYKRYIIIGFALSTIGIFGLSFLQVDSPYWQQAIFMAITGIGFGSGMPILNLAVQNEFSEKHLGVATASSQLFRGLGSTVGTAVLTAMLTAGVAGSLGDVRDTPYVTMLQQIPEAKQLLGDGEISVNTTLQLNSQRTTIADQAAAGIHSSHLPSALQQKQLTNFHAAQDDFATKINSSFAASLRTVFAATAISMTLALIAVSFIHENPLRDDRAHHSE